MTGVTGNRLLPTGPMAALASSADRQALVPMVVGYLILMAALAFGLWRMYRPGTGRQREGPQSGTPQAGPTQAAARQAGSPEAARQAGPSRGGWAALARRVAGTVVGGYLLLMATVVAYYYGVARIGGNFFESAVTGTALLVGLTMPVYAAASWLTERPRRHRDGSADAAPDRR